MAIAVVGDEYLVTLKGSLQGQTILNTFGYKLTVLTAGRTVNAMGVEIRDALAIDGTFTTEYLNCVSLQYSFDQMWVQTIRPVRYVKQVFNFGLDGEREGDSRTANLAAVITKKGERAGRKHVGSTHIPCPGDDANIIAGTLTAAYKLALAAFALKIAEPLALFGDGTIAAPIIIHSDPGTITTPIVSTEVQTTVRVMRRRTVGLGI